ncbi:MAG: hypothetical protein LBT89_08180 [Planctomycetaceae bacterium]|jgi:2-isopropylmalate synthase|nr:hypothetical protein [Planctomycetaceae bacterium]
MKRLTILDTTLRDGDHAAGFAFSPADKPQLALGLAEAGVDIVEAGFPLASRTDYDACRNVTKILEGGHTKAAMMCRGNKNEIKKTAAVLGSSGVLHITLPVSGSHIASGLNISRLQLLKKAEECVSFASGLVSAVEIGAEDASRADIDFLCEYCETVIEAGATIVNIADTLGVLSVPQVAKLIKLLQKKIPSFSLENTASGSAVLSVHFHNDCGLAAANTLAAVEAGCGQIETTVCGIGERSGNAALEEIAVNLAMHREIYKVQTGLRLERLSALTDSFYRAAGISLGPLKPVIGWNVHAHTSGIHQKGLESSPDNYSSAILRKSGSVPQRIVLSRHSGKSGVRMAAAYCGLGELNDKAAEKILCRVKTTDKRTVGLTEFLVIIGELGLLPKGSPNPVCCSFFSEQSAGGFHRIKTTLSDGRTYHGKGATAESAVMDTVNKISPFQIALERAELNGMNGQYRLYTIIKSNDKKTALERYGASPNRLMFECCLDVINRCRFMCRSKQKTEQVTLSDADDNHTPRSRKRCAVDFALHSGTCGI